MNPEKNTSDSCICRKTSSKETRTQILKCDMVDGKPSLNLTLPGTPKSEEVNSKSRMKRLKVQRDEENAYDNERFLYDGGLDGR